VPHPLTDDDKLLWNQLSQLLRAPVYAPKQVKAPNYSSRPSQSLDTKQLKDYFLKGNDVSHETFVRLLDGETHHRLRRSEKLENDSSLEDLKRFFSTSAPVARTVVKTSLPSHPLKPLRTPVLEPTTRRALRRRRLHPEKTLDLHGLTESAAHATVLGFITRAHKQGLKLVAIITGKGKYSEKPGILRQRVPEWLKLPPCSEKILGFETAAAPQGGEGMLYVRLRHS
jgi:DNA-nicking Smr family endonuclease